MKRILIVALVLIVLVLTGAAWYLLSLRPNYNQTLSAPGLTNKIVIKRNRYAVPLVEAESLEDLYFGWGYVNAQDRMFQIEITKRIGQGRISEFAGPSTVDKDLFLRALGFYEIAQKEADNMFAKHRALLQRFVDGINFYQNTHQKPLYMTLLGIEPEPWTLADPLVVGMMLNWTLAYNMSNELMYYEMRKKVGPEAISELMNLIPDGTPTIVDGYSGGGPRETRFLANFKNWEFLLGGMSASNNWVVGPEKTSVMGPILASDPHVHGSKIPSDFYLVRLRTPEISINGGQVAGFPFIAFGYNSHLAWGLTNQGADIVDVFLEDIDWENKTCRRQGETIPLTSKTFEIKIKGEKPVAKTVYYNGRRPVLNEVFTDIDKPVSLDWVGFDGIGVDGFFALNVAKNFQEWRWAAKKIRMTPQNMVYADRAGYIAYRTLGALPKRRPGTGNLPTPADQANANWDGIIDPDQNPSVRNPERRYIATANNLVVRDYPYDMNPTVALRYRYDRLAEMLEIQEPIDTNYMAKMQTDVQSRMVPVIKPLLENFVDVKTDPQASEALKIVLDWDGRMETDLVAPSIYNTFIVRFMYQTFEDELGPDLAEKFVSQRYVSLERFLQLIERNSRFFDDTRTPEKESVQDIATRAFKETLTLLAEYLDDPNISSWEWGKIHHLQYNHFLGKSKLLKPFVDQGPFPMKGDGETNCRGYFYEVKPPFTATLASGLRLVVAFDPEPKGQMVLITGQNEYFLSRHYFDMAELWMEGGYFQVEDPEVIYLTELNPQ
jgi:penicillin amidase